MRAIAETFVTWQIVAAAMSELIHFVISLI
jgi:hypothetical protein